MKARIPFNTVMMVIATLFTACNTSYFENEIDDFIWEGRIKAPIGHATYTLSELFDELEVSGIEENEDGVLSFSYAKTFLGGNESSFDVAIEDATISSSIETPINSTLLPGITLPHTLIAIPTQLENIEVNNTHDHSLPLRHEVTGASFDEGIMTIVFESTFDGTVTLNMNIPTFIRKDNDTESYIGSIILDGAESKELVIDLKEYNANFTYNKDGSNNTTNSILLNLNALFSFAIGNELRSDDKITYTAQLSNASADVVYGDFKQEGFDVDNDFIPFDFYDDFDNGDITFTDASMTISASNGFGFPIGIDVSNIFGDTGVGTNQTNLSYESNNGDEIAAGNNMIIIDGIETYSSELTSVSTTTILNKDNSNINELLATKPTRFNINVSGISNPIADIINTNFYASVNNGLSVNVIIKVPLEIEFNDVKFSPQDIKIDLDKEIDEIKDITLKIITINSTPLKGIIDLTFFSNIDPTVSILKSIPEFDSATIDATGKSSGIKNTLSTIEFSPEELELLKKSTHISLDVTFNSPGRSVSLAGSNAIKVIISADIEIEINTIEINE